MLWHKHSWTAPFFSFCSHIFFLKQFSLNKRFNLISKPIIDIIHVQVERTWDLVRDSGQRKLTSSFQNHCTLHSVPVGAKPLSPRQCAPSRSIYLSRRLNSHWEILVTTHHLQKWESQLRLRWTRYQIWLYIVICYLTIPNFRGMLFRRWYRR